MNTFQSSANAIPQNINMETYYRYLYYYLNNMAKLDYLQNLSLNSIPLITNKTEPLPPVCINTNSAFNVNLSMNNNYPMMTNDSSKDNIDVLHHSSIKLRKIETKRNLMKITSCPHRNLRHYAKGMCSNCYHSKGRTKRPWKCSHYTKSLYAKGLCQNCYQFNYLKNNHNTEEMK